jgi:hypothetical protein
MLCRLKITVHDIATTPPKVPKGSLDHDLHVLIRAVGLYYLFVLLLYRRTKVLFCSFTLPPFHRILVTLVY